MSTQNITYNLPDDVVEQLLCSYCNAYLSCAPIRIGSNGDAICGRCAPPDDEGSVHQVLFETTMAKFLFPCRYKSKGCKKQVLFNHAVEHEEECPYRTFCCPSLPHGSCAENLSVFDLHQHFNQTHQDLILNDGKFKLLLGYDIQYNLLMVKDDVTVFIQYQYDAVKNILYLDVRRVAWDDAQVVHYKLQMISGKHSDNTVNLPEKICNRFESHTLNMQSATMMILDSYLSVLENPDFIYIATNLTTTFKNSTNDNTGNFSDSNLSLLNTNLHSSVDDDCEQRALAAWNSLEKKWCCYCHTCIVPPVYYYQFSGRWVCNNCRTSGSEIKMEMPNFPCRWIGCTFIGDESNIKNHIENCEFRTYICPLPNNCENGYFTSTILMEHMNKHGKYCPNPQKIVIDLFCTSSSNLPITKQYFTVFENYVAGFRCFIRDKYVWTLTGTAEHLCMEIYFEHDHCRFKSETYSGSTFEYNHSCEKFPLCFKSCRNISAVIKITGKKQ